MQGYNLQCSFKPVFRDTTNGVLVSKLAQASAITKTLNDASACAEGFLNAQK